MHITLHKLITADTVCRAKENVENLQVHFLFKLGSVDLKLTWFLGFLILGARFGPRSKEGRETLGMSLGLKFTMIVIRATTSAK